MEIDFESGKEQIIVSVDDAEARRLNLSTSRVALALRRLLSGEEVSKIRESDEDINIRIFLEKNARQKLESLKLLMINNDRGQKIPLNKVVKLKRRKGTFVIRRFNQKRVISVQASIDKAKTTPLEVARTFAPKWKKFWWTTRHLITALAGKTKTLRIPCFVWPNRD